MLGGCGQGGQGAVISGAGTEAAGGPGLGWPDWGAGPEAVGRGGSPGRSLLPFGDGAQVPRAGASGHPLSGFLGVTVTHDHTWVA